MSDYKYFILKIVSLGLFGDIFLFKQSHDELGRQKFAGRLTWFIRIFMLNFRPVFLIV